MDLITDLKLPFPLPTYVLALVVILGHIAIFKLYIYILPLRLSSISMSYPPVLSVPLAATHAFTKTPTPSITPVERLGVHGDAHAGETVQHRSRLHIKPPPANLRQVHLIQNEILQDFGVAPAEIGENVTTVGIDLLALSKGTKLRFIGPDPDGNGGLEMKAKEEPPTITITGLRNPCPQIDKHREGLQEKFIVRDEERKIITRKAGVMSTVDVGGDIRPGMRIQVEEPNKFEALGCV